MSLKQKTKIVIAAIYIFIICSALILNAQSVNQIYLGKTLSNRHYEVRCMSMVVDAAGNQYATGYFRGTFDFDPGSGIFNMTAGNDDIFICKLGARGNLEWVKKFGGSASMERGMAVALDNSGMVYVTGYSASDTDFDPGNGVVYLPKTGMSGMFISKLDNHGNLIWVKPSGGLSIAIDASDCIYMTGCFNGRADFDPGNDQYILNAVMGSSFVSKLDSDGNFLWAKQMGDLDAVGLSVTLDENANVYSTGSFGWTADFDPGDGVSNLEAMWESTYISKLDSSGKFIWAKQLACSGDFPYSIVVDSFQHVYVSGTFQDAGDFDPGTGIYSMIVEGGDRDQDVFITKLDDNGNFVWSRQIGGTRLESAATLAIDKQAYLYISGFFSDTTNFSPGVSDFKLIANNNESVAEELRMYTCKFDSEGNFIWAVKMNNDTGQFFASVQLDNSGNVVATVADDTIREAVALPQWNDMESISKPFYSLSDDKATVFPETSAEFRIGEQPELSVFPNPTKGEIHIGLQKSYDHISVKVSDILGQLFNTHYFNKKSQISFNMDGPPGLYVVEIFSMEEKLTTISVIKN